MPRMVQCTRIYRQNVFSRRVAVVQSRNVYWPVQTYSISNIAQATTTTITELQSSTIYGSSEAPHQSSSSYENTEPGHQTLLMSKPTQPSTNFCLSYCTSICNTTSSSKIQKQSTISYASIKQVMRSTESYGTSESTQQSSVSYGSTKSIPL